MNTNYLISTDLDGTLLDHYNYSWSAALPSLQRCRDEGITVILNTSKTFAETHALQQALSLDGPIIVENGSALIMPRSSVSTGYELSADDTPSLETNENEQRLIFGKPRAEILNVVSTVRQEKGWSFEGFNDWSIGEIVCSTGLSPDDAAKAANKQYSEPILWKDSDTALSEFRLFVEKFGLAVLRGGRFHHLQGQTDKAKPLRWLKSNPSAIRRDSSSNSQMKLICLGDNHNDVAMLEIADYPVCIRSPVSNFPQLSTSRPIFHTRLLGPMGWNEAVQFILDER